MLPKKYRDIKRNLIIKRSIAGLGLFTKESIERGGFVIEYKGSILTEKEANLKGGKYLFETSKNRFIDGSSRKNIARYINHSCLPNCEIDIKRGRIYIFTKRKIKSGEELFYDYDKEYFNELIKPFGCQCLKCKIK
ncbi:MAG: SET domain-containing protein-lysine N-methyltransferase [Candidatus Zambryskibacteria bacterium CG10_big_fil_rev_8_21_14_0_10_34_34]|uniref:SET domain-containing protein-lysine N-methyltransferase n=1 Tax=Candidatus Zambryskibacteria bacterium CG10_big_fil_rev_8_21_14_0_10_34_34 TaxID=1975114 RepID=A0A2H0R143_9BACT|nr:MAG: SET domain-containing protein-lysine N-methyltransferase [Candidatus Zambryskibacteria bacterium CG10_big_fil_rev_8_21_14_0_10_34_34]